MPPKGRPVPDVLVVGDLCDTCAAGLEQSQPQDHL